MASNKVMADLAIRITTQTSELNKGLRDARTKVNSFSKGMKSLGAVMVGVFALNAIKNFSMEAAKLAGVAAGVSVAFAKLQIPIENLREATKGTVSDLNLMKQAVKANEFGIPLENLGTLLKFASIQAQKMGENVDTMLDSLIGSLSTQSKMRLDNLGISMASMNEEMRNGSTFAEAAFTLIDVKLEGTSGLLETAETKTAALSAAYDNLKVTIGRFINEGGSPFITWTTKAIIGIGDIIEKMNEMAGTTLGIIDSDKRHQISIDLAWAKSQLQKFEDELANPQDQGALSKLIFGDNAETLKNNITIAKELVAELKSQMAATAGKKTTLFDDLPEKIKKTTFTAEQLAFALKPVNEEMDALAEHITVIAEKDPLAFLKPQITAAQGYAIAMKAANDKINASFEESSARQTAAITASAEAMKVKTGEMADMGNVMQNVFTTMGNSIVSAFEGTKNTFQSFIKSMLSIVVRFIAMMLAKSLASSIAIGTQSALATGPLAVGLLPGMIAASTASVLGAFTALPKFASGGVGGGFMRVGERGAETIFAPQGSRVVSHADSMKALSGGSGGSGGRLVVDDILIRGEDLRIVLGEADRKHSNSL